MATLDDLEQALIDSAATCAQAATACTQAAMVAAHIVDPPEGTDVSARNMSDASAMASTAAQAMAATRDAAQALAALGATFPPAA